MSVYRGTTWLTGCGGERRRPHFEFASAEENRSPRHQEVQSLFAGMGEQISTEA